ncbi:hypothetical protein BVRB_019420, partial [Beta vulgaris subsp. vulgaris]
GGDSRQLLYMNGIHQEFSDTRMAFQNGLPEVIGGKLVAMIRAGLVRSGAPEIFWTNAASNATWIHNRVPLDRHQGKTTPFEVLTGHRPNLSRARVWGCEAWVMIRRPKKDKLKPKAERAVYIGVSTSKKAWEFLIWKSRKILESRNAFFYESVFPFKEDGQAKDVDKRAAVIEDIFDVDIEDDNLCFTDDAHTAQGGVGGDGGAADHHDEPQDDVACGDAVIENDEVETGDLELNRHENDTEIEQHVLRRTGRIRKPPVRFADVDYDGFARAARRPAGGRNVIDDESGGMNEDAQVDESVTDALQDEIVDVEDAEAAESCSTEERGDGDDIFYDAQENHEDGDWACYCSIARRT